MVEFNPSFGRIYNGMIVSPSELPDELILHVKNDTGEQVSFFMYAKFAFPNAESPKMTIIRRYSGYLEPSKWPIIVKTEQGVPISRFEMYPSMELEGYIEFKVLREHEYMGKKYTFWDTIYRWKFDYIIYNKNYKSDKPSTTSDSKDGTAYTDTKTRLQAAVINGFKKRPVFIEIAQNVFILDVSETVKQVAPNIQGAWLVVDMNLDKFTYVKGWTLTEEDTKPSAIVKKWLSGKEVERLTIDGNRYTITAPCSIMIVLADGNIQFGGDVLSKIDMLNKLKFYGLLEGTKKDKTLILVSIVLGILFILIAIRGLRR